MQIIFDIGCSHLSFSKTAIFWSLVQLFCFFLTQSIWRSMEKCVTLNIFFFTLHHILYTIQSNIDNILDTTCLHIALCVYSVQSIAICSYTTFFFSLSLNLSNLNLLTSISSVCSYLFIKIWCISLHLCLFRFIHPALPILIYLVMLEVRNDTCLCVQVLIANKFEHTNFHIFIDALLFTTILL